MDEDKIDYHESFVQVSFSRHNSNKNKSIYGSSIGHNETLVLEVYESEVHRHLSRSWYSPRKKIMELEMSQSQFAELITTMNMGSGIPCNLNYFNGKHIENNTLTNILDVFKKEFQNDLNGITKKSKETIEEIQNILNNKTVTKKDLKKALDNLYHIKQDLESNLTFILSQFNEQMNKTVVEAKGEVEAFVENKIRSAGLSSIAQNYKLQLNSCENNEIESNL